MEDKELTILMEVRRNLNEQVVQLMFVDDEEERDLANVKGLLNGAIRKLEGVIESRIKQGR